jgi:hypothetical protein
MLSPEFEWHDRKARQNFAKHGVRFEEAATVFADPIALGFADMDHSVDEERRILIGSSVRSRLLFVVYCETSRTGDRIRLISARRATRAEKRLYEENREQHQ